MPCARPIRSAWPASCRWPGHGLPTRTTPSSDAAFADRYQAGAAYQRVREGTIALEGGWRVYSSGAGILFGLVVRHLYGLRLQADSLLIDPVMPPSLDGTRLAVSLLGETIEIDYRVAAPGFGVKALHLDDAPLPFTLEPNPYRAGAGPRQAGRPANRRADRASQATHAAGRRMTRTQARRRRARKPTTPRPASIRA